jgi:hypothetical protein
MDGIVKLDSLLEWKMIGIYIFSIRFGMWATNGQGLGSWIEMSFKENILFTRLQIKNRNDIAERSAEVELSFGVLVQETIKLKLKNSNIYD